MRVMGNAACIGDMNDAYKTLVGDLEGKKSSGRRRRKQKGNTKGVLEEGGSEDVQWTRLAKAESTGGLT
jgi:hypothetical protein